MYAKAEKRKMLICKCTIMHENGAQMACESLQLHNLC